MAILDDSFWKAIGNRLSLSVDASTCASRDVSVTPMVLTTDLCKSRAPSLAILNRFALDAPKV